MQSDGLAPFASAWSEISDSVVYVLLVYVRGMTGTDGCVTLAAWAGPAMFAKRLNQAAPKWNATGDLAFLNEW